MLATKKLGDELFFGSTCKQGEIEVIIIVIGVYTFLGKVALLVDSMNNMGHFQKVFSLFVCVFFHCFYLHWHAPPSLYVFHFFYLGHVKHNDQDFMGFCMFL
jgi:hypothetical protein